jgi:hypothetical protein
LRIPGSYANIIAILRVGRLTINYQTGANAYEYPSPYALLSAMAISALWTCGTPAQPTSVGPSPLAQEQFICRLPGTSDRRIGIYRPPGGPQRCRVDYTRDGKTRSLWSSGHDYEFCVSKALEIVGLLEGANFKCSPQTREAPGPG